jgi:DnaK suppressor protein
MMNKKELKRFKEILLQRKNELLRTAETTRERGMVLDTDDLADEVDLASSEADQSMNLLLRDRERVLVKKIDKALAKIENGEYGVCESCGEEIGLKRLEARPVTDLCIRCKEEQERIEKSYAE